MIDVKNIRITADESDLQKNWSVFTIRFEYDNRILVCHTFEASVLKSAESSITKALRGNNIELRRAILNSAGIAISVDKSDIKDTHELMRLKYDLIKERRCYGFDGYNSFEGVDKIEKPYAMIAVKSILDEIDKEAAHPEIIRGLNKRGRTPRAVYCFNKNGALFQEFSSIKEAHEKTGIQASNINMCCNGRIKSAGGFIWSYNKLKD